MIENKQCCNKLLISLNKVVQENKIPNKWNHSITRLIEKKTNKSKIYEIRPITLANNSYKYALVY